ncbi:MAG: hypothetical protein P0Y64_14845 [Candidatus Sphingomonas colombiensis]|nr:DUF6628 family protein [Sphingomonas sp.]WEK42644.1 MAG: hypothetical protein P0Y64_14845 [Sphingomonas sp.]
MTLPAATMTAAALPYPLPPCPNARVLLFAMRRMGAHGLADARAAHAIFTLFREGFRRPLTLVRTLMADLAGNASMPIAIAPCCCGRITVAEAGLLTIVARVETAPETAALLLGDLLGIRRADGVLASVAAVSAAFADEGRPILA